MDNSLVAWPTLLMLAFGLRMAIRLHYGARGPTDNDAIYHFLNILSWVLFVLVGFAVSVIGLILLVLAYATFVEVIVQRRAAQRRSICTLLALFVERRQPIETSVLMSANTMRGRVGRAARYLFDSLSAGMPLKQAVSENPSALPREAAAYVSVGDSMQTQAAALRELSRADHSAITALLRSCIDRTCYLGCVMLVMFSVLTFIMIKIVPAYQQIFEEFATELPAPTQLAVAISSSFESSFLGPLWMIVLATAFLMLVFGFIIGICYLVDLHPLQFFGDRILRGRRTADVLRILAVATEGRRPIAEALYQIAGEYPAGTIRRQLRPATATIMAGGEWQAALERARVVSPAEAALLQAAERSGNLPWALRQVATRREKRAFYRLDGAIQVIYPAMILLLGGVVGFFVISLFMPIVKLIQGLTN